MPRVQANSIVAAAAGSPKLEAVVMVGYTGAEVETLGELAEYIEESLVEQAEQAAEAEAQGGEQAQEEDGGGGDEGGEGPRCAACGKTEGELLIGFALKKCARCKAVQYCGTDCQRRHWRGGHKAVCKPVGR